MPDEVVYDGAWEGTTGNYSCIQDVHPSSHEGSVAHRSQQTTQSSVFHITDAAPLATRDSAASSSPVLRFQTEAARHDELRVMGDVHARCSYPDGPVFSREGY